MSEERPAPSPLAPLIGGLGLLLLVAALATKTLTTGGGIELKQPGAQLLFDVTLLCGAAALVLARALAGRGPGAPRAVLAASAAWALVLVVAAARAPSPDIAWRTALSWTGLLLLALVAMDLGRASGAERLGPCARALSAAAVALVVCAAGLALWQRFVEHPRLLAEYRQGTLEGELGPMDAAFRQAMHERIHSPEAAGPFLLPALLCCACAMLLPLVLAATWPWRRRPEGAGLALVALALLGAAAQTESKGGAIALVASLGALAVLHPRAAPWRRRALAGLGALGALALVLGLAAWAMNPDAEGVGLSLAVRLEYWTAGLAIAREHPLLGAGLNQFRELYPTFKLARGEEALHAHNALVQLLAETGAVGVLAALGLLAAWGRTALRGLDGRDRASSMPDEAAPREDDDEAPGALAWTLGGLGLGWFLVGAFGDAYGFQPDTLAHMAALAVALPLVAVLGWRALACVPPRLVAAALLAGVAAFLADGLLDFGLHHAGVSTVAALLVGLGAGVAQGPGPDDAPRRRLGLGLGFAAGALALGVMGLVAPGALSADQARARAEEARVEAASARPAERAALLDAAAEDLALATSAYPWHARTWLERAAVEAARGRLDAAIEAAEAAVACAPASASAWGDLGTLRRQAGDLAGGLAALEEAARRYPTDPGHLLALGLARAEDALRAGRPPEAVARAREALGRSLAASDAVRQVSRRLSAEQLVVLGRALHDLAEDEASRREALAPLRRALALDDEARAARAAGRRVPDPLRELSAASRAEAERLLGE